jgi:hypothetical protein
MWMFPSPLLKCRPDIDLTGEMKRSGLAAICMTFATDYQQGDATFNYG